MRRKKLRVYLDNCCYNRPFDNQRQLSIQLETQSKLWIQGLIRDNQIDLAISFFSLYENNANNDTDKAEHIRQFFSNAAIYVDETYVDDVRLLLDDILATGIKLKDAIHLASAIIAGVDYFITTDKRLLKYQPECMRVINPIEFISRWENRDDDE